jgi:hypothetical protein
MRLVTRLVAPLVVDFSASPRLVVDYSTARPGASARRAARHAGRRAARRRLLCLALARVDYSASRRLVVDYFTSAARPGASARRAVLTVKIRQPSHEFTIGVGMSFIPYPLVLTPVV